MIYDVSGNALTSVYLVNGNRAESAYNVSGNEIYRAEIPLKVMTYNVGEWYYGAGDNVPADKDAAYYALQNGMIARNDPDVLCIQEYWKTFSKTGRTALSMLQQHFPYIIEQGGVSGYYGHCVCSKYPITDYTVRGYANEQRRYYDSCTVTIQGIPITIVNTHLALTQSARNAQISELISFLRTQERFVCCGDYNPPMTESEANPTSQTYIENVKPFLDAGFQTANFGDFGFILTYVDRSDGHYAFLDNEYLSSNITINNVYADHTKMTDDIDDPIDHMPLIVEMTIR